MKTIKIDEQGENFLSVSIHQILKNVNRCEQFYWGILWLKGIGENILKLEKSINKNQDGYILSWFELEETLSNIDSIEEILLVGDLDKFKLKRYESDTEMRLSCEYCIELVDSSYWLVSSVDSSFIEKVRCLQKELKLKWLIYLWTPRPNSMVNEYQKEYQGVHYDPKAGKTTIDPKKEEEK